MPTVRTLTGRRAGWPVALVSMPFADVDRPSIQLGLLKTIGESHGFPVRTLHAGLDFAAHIGLARYRALAAHRGSMVGDWLFSVEAFRDDAPDPDARLLEVADLPDLGLPPERVRDWLLQLRRKDVPTFLDALVDTIAWGDIRVVGFTSTFQQNSASFALARRLKARWPGIVTLFGGANFDGEMGLEYVRAIDCVDFAVVGEGDVAFPRLLCALADGSDPGLVPGVARRLGGKIHATAPEALMNRMDDLPAPDYTEYFTHAVELGILPDAAHRDVWIPFESARGCWWGQKHHCTFCGLNGNSMQFRAKSAGRLLDELAVQAQRYHSFRFEAVDNILDPGYLTTLLPAIVASGADYEIFYEVKANLSRAQLKLLAEAGIRHLQPGLESLSSRVLHLMRKGVRAAQNVNVLRWARYYGIDVAWNILWGFPGETERDYAEQASVVPHLLHLQPPASAERLWLERYSPMFHDSDTFALRSRTPEGSYRYVYPRSVDLDRAAYFFDYELAAGLPEHAYDDLRREVDTWSAAWRAGAPPTLTYWSAPGFLQINDSRHEKHSGTYTFYDPLAAIYLACTDRPTTASAVCDRLDDFGLTAEAVQEAFHEFQQRGLMFVDGSLAVALALPAVSGR